MKELPDFVLPYKAKGFKIKEEKGNYYLYRVKSHREKGKSYPVVTSQYVGVIDREKGLIESHPPVKGEVRVYRYGFYSILRDYSKPINSTVAHYAHQNRDLILAQAIMTAAGEKISPHIYESSYLSLLFPDIKIDTALDEKEKKTFESILKRLKQYLRSKLAEDLDEIKTLSSLVYLVHVNGKWFISAYPDRLKDLLAKHGLEFIIPEEIQ